MLRKRTSIPLTATPTAVIKEDTREDTGVEAPLLTRYSEDEELEPLNMASTLEVAGAAASLSMADVDMTDVGKKKSGFGIVATATFIATAALGVTAIMAMAIEKSVIVYIAMSISCITAPYAAMQRFSLAKGESLRQVHNKVRNEANRLQLQNNELHVKVSELEEQVGKVKDIESGLSDIVTTQGENVDQFVAAVKENRKVLDAIKENLEASVLQSILTVVIKSDRDEDFIIDPEEVDILVLRLQNSNGVELEEDKFRAMLEKKGYKLTAVLDVVKNMMDKDNVAEEERVVHVNSRGLKLEDI